MIYRNGHATIKGSGVPGNGSMNLPGLQWNSDQHFWSARKKNEKSTWASVSR